MFGFLTPHVPPTTPVCVRGHDEINNVPEHTLDNGTVIPAERQVTPVCDEEKTYGDRQHK